MIVDEETATPAEIQVENLEEVDRYKWGKREKDWRI